MIYQRAPLKQHWTMQILRRLLLVSLFALMCNVLTIPVQGQAANEYQVKAAFIFNFAKFIDWPGDAFGEGGVLVVGVVGEDPFGRSLDNLSGNIANGRRLRIKRLRWNEDLRSCQILFISNSEQRHLGKIMDNIRGTSILTIGEMPQFNQAGGIIKFVIQDYKVRFEINAGAAVQARLKISSKLLALSKGGRN